MHPPERLSDLPPVRAAAVERARRCALDFLADNQYQLVVPPLAEHWETLAVGGGDLNARTFQMTDTLSGRALGIRADHTPQIARYDAASGQTGIRRWAYCGPALRTRADLPWRSREILQLGAELFGADSPQGDLEIARVAAGTLRAAGVADPKVDFGHAGLFASLVAECDSRPSDSRPDFRSVAREAVSRRDAATLSELAADNPKAEALCELAEISGPVDDAIAKAKKLLDESPARLAMLDELAECVRQTAAAGWDAEVDLSELGGYEYHDGIVFAFYGDNGLAARGGRYAVAGRGESAAGFSLDLREVSGQ